MQRRPGLRHTYSSLLNNKIVEIVDSMKILGTIFTDKLKWDKNCNEIVLKVNRRMRLLKKMHSFGANIEEMVHLWIVYCRSTLDQSAVIWAGSLSEENKEDLERTQKSFTKIVLRKQYQDGHENAYENALKKMNLQSLEQRRKELCLQFAKDSIKNGILNDLFRENLNTHEMKTRNPEKYEVLYSNRDRMRKSSIVYMQNLLNEDHEKRKTLTEIHEIR